MKKITVLFIVLFTLLTVNSFAQENEYRSTISAGVGQSLVKVVSDLFLDTQLFEESGLKYTSLPAFFVNYDYSVNDWFSVGAAGSYQIFRLKEISTSDYVQINRINVGLRGLFHYGSSDKIDMYSGVRLSTTMWNLNSNIISGDPNVDDFINDLNSTKFFDKTVNIAPQIVAFGIKGYFNDNFGAHIEFSIGSPYYMSGGVNFRF